MANKRPDWQTINDDGSASIELNKTYEVDGAKVGHLRMREPTVEDQLAFDEGKGTAATREVGLIANLCQVTPDDIKKLTLRDYKRVQQTLLDFTD